MTARENEIPPASSDVAAGGERRPLKRVTRRVNKRTNEMESSKDHFEQQQPVATGPVGDLQRLKGHSAATAAELREFLGQLKGRTPQEVMGIVAQSSLFQGITTATIACAALLVVFTIVPWVINGGQVASTPTTVATTTALPNDVNDAAVAAASTDGDAIETAPTPPDLTRAADAMGIGEAAEADLDKNPLDSKLDNLLDGIE